MLQGVTITRKIPHGLDLSIELSKAVQVANYALDHPEKLSTKYVRDFKLNSSFSDMVLRHYGNSPPKTFREDKVQLMIAGSKTPVDIENNTIYIRPLKLTLPCAFPCDFLKVRRVLLDKECAYVNMLVQSRPMIETQQYLGIDLNIIGPFAVVWVPHLHQLFEYGQSYYDTFMKYRMLKNEFKKDGKFKMLKRVRMRYDNILTNMLHQTSSNIIKIALASGSGIKMEDLTGIGGRFVMETGKRILLRAWPYYKFRKMIEYKAKRNGIPLRMVSPCFTSTICALHGVHGLREGRNLICPMGHEVNADHNAAMLISQL